MRVPFLGCLLLAIFSSSVSLAAESKNDLRQHPSPYLAMHAEDPVHWQSWDPDLVTKAQREGKLLFLSIGYFACHWCHVMQRESFQDPEIARWLNQFTIPIKVDRELHPALDAQMIDFVQKTRGYAGWPLNVFLSPQGYPLVGLVYMPRAEFIALVKNVAAAWKEDPEGLTRMAAAAAPQWGPSLPQSATGSVDLAVAFEAALWQRADEWGGGFGSQSKFPHVTQLRYLLAQQRSDPQARRRNFLQLTLEQMAFEGLRDHLGGGFFRYTTDPEWQTPHYEKMLYDNAQLLGLYAEAASVLDDVRWMRVAEDTFDFLYRELRTPSGGYRSSLSALDAAGTEGGYYLWTAEQLRASLSDAEYAQARRIFFHRPIAADGEGMLPIPLRPAALTESDKEIAARLRTLLHTARDSRSLPVDNKQLAAWNGLLLQNLVRLAQLSKKPIHHQAAAELGNYLLHELVHEQGLYRTRSGDRFTVQGVLEDYAYTARGLWDWSRTGSAKQGEEAARRLEKLAWERFFNKQGWRLSDQPLPMDQRYPAVEDDSLPSSVATLLSLSLAMQGQEKNQEHFALVSEALAMARGLVERQPFEYVSFIPLLSVE